MGKRVPLCGTRLWQDPQDPLRLVEQSWQKDDPDPKALACDPSEEVRIRIIINEYNIERPFGLHTYPDFWFQLWANPISTPTIRVALSYIVPVLIRDYWE